MPIIKKIYRTFYLDGRDDVIDNGVDGELEDITPLATQVLDGASLYHTTYDAAKAVLAPLWFTEKKQFLEDSEVEIKAAGGDSTLAFEQWMEGRTDELRSTIEIEVLNAMHDELDEGDDDEEDDEGEEGQDDEDGAEDEEEEEGDD